MNILKSQKHTYVITQTHIDDKRTPSRRRRRILNMQLLLRRRRAAFQLKIAPQRLRGGVRPQHARVAFRASVREEANHLQVQGDDGRVPKAWLHTF